MAKKDALKLYGDAPVNANGQVTIPADARRDMGLQPSTRVIFFGRPETCELIVMPAPPPAEHLAFVAEQSRRARHARAENK